MQKLFNKAFHNLQKFKLSKFLIHKNQKEEIKLKRSHQEIMVQQITIVHLFHSPKFIHNFQCKEIHHGVQQN